MKGGEDVRTTELLTHLKKKFSSPRPECFTALKLCKKIKVNFSPKDENTIKEIIENITKMFKTYANNY